MPHLMRRQAASAKPQAAPSLQYSFMQPEPYLPRLTARLADGLSRQPADFRARHADFVRRCQRPDGGFPGREGGSDLYYTGFALRCLAVLDALTPDLLDRA